MREVTHANFGLLIAYLLPGFVALWGIGYFSETVGAWLGATPAEGPTVGGFLYVTLASVAVGMIISAVRWAVLDSLHHLTGVAEPQWDFSHLHERLAAFEGLVENHYRHYQFYGNVLVAAVFTHAARRAAAGPVVEFTRSDILFLMVVILLAVSSRDALTKYYKRSTELLIPTETRADR